ncbi:MAG TPA: MBL fold metallo-hydrolase [Mycobacteriales bacterium]|nr:MBL fold metallo-hydrolase [Mycobacteriales bacterium]
MPWTEPGAHPVADGVTRIPLPLPNDGLRAVNVYAVETADGLVLVDGGWAIPAARDQLVAALAEIGAGLGDVRRFLVTHVHRDHYTNAVAVRREVGSSVALGAGDRPTLELLNQPDRSPLATQVHRLRRLGAPALADEVAEAVAGHRPDPEHWELPDEWLTDGELPLPGGRTLAVVETPGHTAGHVVFHDTDARLLFAGDHVLPTITPSIGFEPALTADPLGAFLRSLALVRSRPDALLLPAHGPVADSVHARVDELVAHHGRRLDEVEAALRSGAATVAEVARILTWTRRERAFDELDRFNAMLAVFETGAHLELLAVQGRVHEQDDGAVLRYTL